MKFDLVFRRAYALGALIAVIFTLTGCFHMRGVVSVKPDGNHVGSYVFSMNSATYATMVMSEPGFLDNLKEFSNPTVWAEDGVTYIADKSGEADMLGFYDSANCDGEKDLECTYQMVNDDLDVPGWSVDWEVQLAKDIEIVRGNYQSIDETGSAHTMTWHFDGNKVSRFAISYTIRLPSDRPSLFWLFKLIPFFN